MYKIAILGAGSRGAFAYAPYAKKRPDQVQIVAVAEPNKERRERFSKEYGIAPEHQYESWEDLLEKPKFCDAVVICTQDRDHYKPAMKALERGYHILLEKPMSHLPDETLRMAREAKRLNRILAVCHTMRYSTYYNKLKQLIDSGVIGKLMSIQWTENVGFWHYIHSFVRGNWRNSDETSPMILQKCCHDMDMLRWLIGSECTEVSSFGELSYFKIENAPEGSTDRCTDGCAVEHECPFSAIKWYLNEKDQWPQKVVSLEPTIEARMKALKEGPYGRCVYRCDNNVVDHQVASLKFANGVTVAFTMSAFTMENTRTFKIMGTQGEILGHHEKNEIEIRHFSGQKEVVYPMEVEGGHRGGDTLIMRDFIRMLDHPTADVKTSGLVSAEGHLIAFAVEESRITGKTIKMSEYIRQFN